MIVSISNLKGQITPVTRSELIESGSVLPYTLINKSNHPFMDLWNNMRRSSTYVAAAEIIKVSSSVTFRANRRGRESTSPMRISLNWREPTKPPALSSGSRLTEWLYCVRVTPPPPHPETHLYIHTHTHIPQCNSCEWSQRSLEQCV